MYNAKSMKAEEFICHEEILDTLAYAEANKNNKELLEQIIAKAKLRKGLSHREASVLLACEDEKLVQEMFALAEQIKRILRQPYSAVCSAVFIQLLYQSLRLLSLPCYKQAYRTQKADAG